MTALIILAAVVALIATVIWLGMRYLRADDDDFDDARGRGRRDLDRAPRERRPSGHVPAGRGRQPRDDRFSGPDDRFSGPDDRDGGWDRGARGRRTASADEGGRGWRAEVDGADRRRRLEADADHRDWRSDEGRRGQSAGQRPQQRASRDGRPAGRTDRGESDEFTGPGARDGRGQDDRGGSRGVRDRDDLVAASHDSRQGYPSRAGRDDRPARSASGRDDRARDDKRDDRARDDRARDDKRDDRAREDRESRGNTRPNARPDGRRTDSGQGKRESLPAVRPRQRGKRDADGDWPSTEWDELSDVDYWAELASDKPFPAAASPPSASQPSRPDRSEPRRAAEQGAGRPDRQSGAADRSLPAKLPARPPRQHEADFPSGPGRRARGGPGGRGDEFSGAGSRRPSASASEPAAAMPAVRPQADGGFRPPVLDDDPLTSPSFPRIGGDDSRSYRRGRADATAERDRGLTPPGGYPVPGRSGSDYPAASTDSYQADPYQSVPSSSSAPQGYPVPASAGTGAYPLASGTVAAGSASGYPLPAAGYPAEQSLPGYQGATRPYPIPAGSSSYLVGQPLGDQPPDYQGYVPASPGNGLGSGPHLRPAGAAYQPPADPGAHLPGAGQRSLPSHGALSQPAAGYAGYTVPGFSGDVGGYQVPVAAPAAQPAGGLGPGYPAFAPGSGQVAAEAGQATAYYPVPNYAGSAELPGYGPAGSEAAGYAGSDPYAVDPYDYPGYGTGGY